MAFYVLLLLYEVSPSHSSALMRDLQRRGGPFLPLTPVAEHHVVWVLVCGGVWARGEMVVCRVAQGLDVGRVTGRGTDGCNL